MLIICRLEMDVVIDVEGKTVEECGMFARRHARDEVTNCRLVSAELATLENLPKHWMAALPYRDRNDGPERTCGQILDRRLPAQKASG